MGKLLMDSTGQSILTELLRHNNNVENIQGSLANLDTTNKLNLVSAINELAGNIGTLGNLDTTNKANLVAALNEILDFTKPLREASGAGLHNSLYRGKKLGTALTAEQSAAIRAGTFDDLWVGDYWEITINSNTYIFRIADFDYFYSSGDTECVTHHVVVVPDTTFYLQVMNATDITTGGYVGSVMYKSGLNNAKTIINNAFGSDHILKHREYLQNAVTSGYPSAGAWYDSTVELMTEQMVYGGKVLGTACNGSTIPNLYTVAKSQLALFRLRPDIICCRVPYWLRDVVSGACFANVNYIGNANYSNASNSAIGVRPAFTIY